MSPAPWAFDIGPAPLSPTVKKYVTELKRLKRTIEKLTPDEQDQRVLKLQRRMLSEQEIRQQSAPAPRVSTDFVHRQQRFLERYKQMEKTLKKMSYTARGATLAQLKRETMGKEYSEPAPAATRPKGARGRSRLP